MNCLEKYTREKETGSCNALDILNEIVKQEDLLKEITILLSERREHETDIDKRDANKYRTDRAFEKLKIEVLNRF